MFRYAMRRLSFLPIILIAVSILTFVLLRVLPTQVSTAAITGAPHGAASGENGNQARSHGPVRPCQRHAIRADAASSSAGTDARQCLTAIAALQLYSIGNSWSLPGT